MQFPPAYPKYSTQDSIHIHPELYCSIPLFEMPNIISIQRKRDKDIFVTGRRDL
jgi:hypothetical protein